MHWWGCLWRDCCKRFMIKRARNSTCSTCFTEEAGTAFWAWDTHQLHHVRLPKAMMHRDCDLHQQGPWRGRGGNRIKGRWKGERRPGLLTLCWLSLGVQFALMASAEGSPLTGQDSDAGRSLLSNGALVAREGAPAALRRRLPEPLHWHPGLSHSELFAVCLPNGGQAEPEVESANHAPGSPREACAAGGRAKRGTQSRHSECMICLGPQPPMGDVRVTKVPPPNASM